MIKRRDNHGLKLWRLPILLLVVLTLMVLAPSPVQAQVALEKYHGGSGDGFTLLTSDKMMLDGSIIANPARYYGGSYDGFTLLTSDELTLDGSIIVNSARYYGGSGDGFTLLTSSTIPLDVPNQPPTVDAVALYESDRTTTATSMTPQVEYAIKVSVTDFDLLFELSTVTVTLYYDANGIYNAGEVLGTGDTQTAAILTLTVGGTPVWEIDPLASTTWTIEGGSSTQPTLTNTSGDFWFHFKPGRVATETADLAKWHIHAVADDGEDTAAGYQDNRGMNWYGEVVTNTTDVTWTDVPPGADFGEESTKQTGISVTCIVNGDYTKKAAASSIWTGASNTATLNEAGTPGAGDFSLKVNDEDVLGTAPLLQATPTYVTIDDTSTQTGESGDTVATNTLWIKAGTPFPSDSYSGTIYHSIAP